jgi:hypothetical protein
VEHLDKWVEHERLKDQRSKKQDENDYKKDNFELVVLEVVDKEEDFFGCYF